MDFIFAKHARRYFERGLSVIPLSGKVPQIKEWQRFSTELPTEDLFSDWERRFSNSNIGLVFGPRTGLVGIDVDCEDPQLISLVPSSPLTRIGKKVGGLRIFNLGDGFENVQRFFGKGGDGIEVLYQGHQCVLPPSIHPDTQKPFYWQGEALDSIDPGDVPTINFTDLLPAIEWLNRHGISSNQQQGGSGRNNQLRDMCSAMRFKGKSDVETAQELVDYDRLNHNPRLFLDSSENFRGTTEEEAFSNAMLFVSRVTASILSSGKRLPQVQAVANLEIEKVEESKFELRSLPSAAPGSFLDLFDSLGRVSTAVDCSYLALGGALTLLSTICGNRIVVRGDRATNIYPNIYSLLIAESGVGKSEVMGLVQKIFEDVDYKFLAGSNFNSSAGVLTALSSYHSSLVIIDEASQMLSSGGEDSMFISTIPEVLNQAYTSTGRKMLGSLTKGKRDGTIVHPYLALLAGTTPGILEELTTKKVAEGGLFARFLFFYQPASHFNRGKVNRSESERLAISCRQWVSAFLRTIPLLKRPDQVIDTEELGSAYDPLELELTKDAQDLWWQYEHDNYELEADEDYRKAMARRKHIHAMKVAALHCVSRLGREVTTQDISYGIAVVDSLEHNTELIFSGAVAEKGFGKQVSKVLSKIKRSGEVQRSELLKQTRLKVSQLDEIIKHLSESGEIAQTIRESSTKPKTSYISLK